MTTGVAKVGELDLAYDERGAGEPLLLIAGFGMTRAMWTDAFCLELVRRGFRVVRFDNRDTGLSTRMGHLGLPPVPKLFLRTMLGQRVTPPYTLEAMADDAVGLMASLGHRRFHVVGASMGGMIAQTIALDHPERLLTMTSIMSTPGGRRYSFAKLGALLGILKPLPKDGPGQLEHFVRLFEIIGGAGGPFEESEARLVAEALVAAKPSSAGSARQFAAILDSSARRRARLPTIRTPTLIVHGSHDPLLPERGSRAMARLISGSELAIVQGMGHMLHARENVRIAELIARHAKRGRKVRKLPIVVSA